jgi:hypothetical protein
LQNKNAGDCQHGSGGANRSAVHLVLNCMWQGMDMERLLLDMAAFYYKSGGFYPRAKRLPKRLGLRKSF